MLISCGLAAKIVFTGNWPYGPPVMGSAFVRFNILN